MNFWWAPHDPYLNQSRALATAVVESQLGKIPFEEEFLFNKMFWLIEPNVISKKPTEDQGSN